MTSSKLKILERQLNRPAASAPEFGANSNDKMMLFYKAEINKEACALVDAAEAKLHKAEVEIARLQNQLSAHSKEASQAHKDALHKMDDMKDVAKQEMTEACRKHSGEMAQMQATINALNNEVATERQEKVRAITQKEAAEKMCTHLEQMVAKLQAVKPVAPAPAPAPVLAPAKPMGPLEFKIRRDEFGHMASIIVTPSV